MTVETANALGGYFQALYDLNHDLITLCGMDIIDNSGQYEKYIAKACIQCAKEAGYTQLELNVVAENDAAISLYQSLGFVEFGRNPRGFNSRISGYQELVYMLLEL